MRAWGGGGVSGEVPFPCRSLALSCRSFLSLCQRSGSSSCWQGGKGNGTPRRESERATENADREEERKKQRVGARDDFALRRRLRLTISLQFHQRFFPVPRSSPPVASPFAFSLPTRDTKRALPPKLDWKSNERENEQAEKNDSPPARGRRRPSSRRARCQTWCPRRCCSCGRAP